jgi:RNA polymerase sigma factor (sigma-70 family)
MDNLDQLVKEYKQTTDKNILNQIFKLLKPTVVDKARFIFYKQKFIKDTKVMRLFDQEKKKFINKECNTYFKLADVKLMEFEDVMQEINLLVLKLIDNYDTNLAFSHYLVSSLKNWRPPCIRDDIIKHQLKNVSTTCVNEEGEETNLIDNIPVQPNVEEPNMEDLFVDLTETDKKIIKILNENPKANHTELAELLGLTDGRISQIITELKNKCKNR